MISSRTLRSITALVLCFYFLGLSSGTVTSANAALQLRVWQAHDGLPDNIIVGVAQSPDCLLWIATQAGLVRFDGVNFRERALLPSPLVFSGNIESLLQDRRGRLWVAKSGGGLICIGADHTQLFSTANGLPNEQAMVMAEDGDGAIWITYASGVLIRLLENEIQSFTEAEGMPSGPGCRIISDKVGQLWFSKRGQVGLFRQGKFVTKVQVPGQSMRLGASHSSGLWIMADRTLYKFNEGGSLEKQGELPTALPDIRPTDIFEDRHGSVWIGTEQAGLFRYAKSVFEKIETSHPEIWPIKEDFEGNIWVGTRGGGLNRIQTAQVELMAVGSPVPGEAAQSLCQTSRGELWAVGRSGALTVNRGGGWQSVSTNGGSKGIVASCVASGHDGVLWIGTRGQGLVSRQTNADEPNYVFSNLSSRNIRSLFVTSDGDVWIGSDRPNELHRLRAGKFQNFSMPTNSGPVCAMALDATGNFWAGTLDGQLLRVTGDELFNETSRLRVAPQPVHSLATTSDGSLWIGFGGGGLGRLKGGIFSRLRAEDGLAENQISQIVPDENGRIWFAGNRGIYYVKESDFTAVTEGRSTTLNCVSVGGDTRSLGLQTSRGFWPGAVRAADGNILIPKASGVAVVNVKNVCAPSPPVTVLMDRVVVDGRTLAAYESSHPLRVKNLLPLQITATNAVLVLAANHQQVRLEYTAPFFSDPANVRFKYKLEGLDENWEDARDRRVAYYTKLSPGNYTFRVLASGADGVWNGSGAMLQIKVRPAFWQTGWFLGLAIMIVITLAVQTARLIEKKRSRRRLEAARREHELERERARIARDIHDDLGANLTEISLLSEIAQGPGASPQEVQADVRQIGEMARRLTVSLSEIVWAVNPRNDTLESFVTYVCNFAQDYLLRAGVRCRLELPATLPSTVIRSELRHNLFLVLKESLNNVVKHARASEVQISFALTEGELHFTIRDNGHGFDPDAGKTAPIGRGNGLSNIRTRVKNLGGRYQLSSHAEKGTLVEVVAPLNRGKAA